MLAVLGSVAACGNGDDERPVDLRTPSGIDVLDALPVARPIERLDPPSRVAGSDKLTLAEFLAWMGGNANTFWRSHFERSGHRYEPAAQLFIKRRTAEATGCGFAYSSQVTFYCDTDDPPTVYLTEQWIEREAKGMGDFAVAFLVAHEWGHHIQNLLGLFAEQERYPTRIKNAHIELMADCLAGVWARAVYRQGLLEPGDREEALRLAAKIADRPNASQNDPDAHGTAVERRRWFARGYETGRAARCKTWSGRPPNPVR